MGYILGTIAVGAVILAIYERRKGKRIVMDDAEEPTGDSARAAHIKAEALRAEASITRPPHGGGMS
ncbi:MAG: hypothetical protein AB8B60_03530 [Sulfitobacter sp.]